MKNWNINRVITQVSTKYGAPMGRPNKGERPSAIVTANDGLKVKKHQPKIYTKIVHLYDGYDKGGAYWGVGKPLFVSFTPSLDYVEFFRQD